MDNVTNVLVTGASGFVGRSLVASLASSSLYKVYAVYRKLPKELPDRVHAVVVEDYVSEANWSSHLKGIDVIIHLAARVHVMNEYLSNPYESYKLTNVEGTLKLAEQAIKASVKRFIFISSIKVNGEVTSIELPFSEKDICHPQGDYALSKYEAEIKLVDMTASSEMEYVVLRPTLVYGPGVKANLLRLIQLVEKGVPLPFKNTGNLRSLIYIDNFVDLIRVCIRHKNAKNQTFLAADGKDLSTEQLIKTIAKSLGKNARLYAIPGKALYWIARLLKKQSYVDRLMGSLRADINKSRTLLNWNPPVDIEDGFKQTVEAYMHETRV